MRTRPDPHVRLRSHLKRHGLTTSDFAKDLGCHRSFVSLIITGRKRPGLTLAAKIEHLTLGAIRAVDWVHPKELRAA